MNKKVSFIRKILMVFLISIFALSGADACYLLEPYVMAWNETTEIIRLETNHPTNVTIEYGLTPSYGSSVCDLRFDMKHELRIDGLNPSTLYYYNVTVENVSDSACYHNSTFLTSQNARACFSFAVLGDSRGVGCGELGGVFADLINKISEKGVDFVIMTGDDIQAYGCSDDDVYWQRFHNITHLIFQNKSFLSAIGNHEDPNRASARVAWRNYWIHPLNGDGVEGHWNETTFMWRYGNSLFIFLNTEEPGQGGDITGNQFTWFNETALTQGGYIHKFVFAHRPLVGSISRPGTLSTDNLSRSALIDNEMYNKGVTAAFYGHNHYYCYNTTHAGRMIHIITGGGGAPLYPTSTCAGTCVRQNHYIIVNVIGNVVNGTVYNLSDNVIHTFSRAMPEGESFDTGSGTYPSIFGTHYGKIIPEENITVNKIYTYPCTGTGGHSELVQIRNETTGECAVAEWNGYVGDYHNLSFDKTLTLQRGVVYSYTIETSSYPQIIHAPYKQLSGGNITCTRFKDANGIVYHDWIPAIRLFYE